MPNAYQLSLKYRPQNFDEVVGQQQVLSSLINSLNAQRINAAYLLTGIRGVGKTTLARIMAKSLNCEQGISATPCNQCQACQAITEGNYPDVFEIDAASRTRVEDTKEILEKTPYQPTVGRFRIFIIDEVHMLSSHSFNALLKTLEEPPEHTKFILATTDPQKIPATVVSRCLQYQLRRLSPDLIAQQLKTICDKEQFNIDAACLDIIANAGEGSLRDALSILQQVSHLSAINEATVLNLLGLSSQNLIHSLLRAIQSSSLVEAIDLVRTSYQQGTQLSKLLDQLITALHELSLYQFNQDLSDMPYHDLANDFSAESLQVLYQAVLLAKRDFDLAPSELIGFEMLLMRLIHFLPAKRVKSPEPNTANTIKQAMPSVQQKPAITESKLDTHDAEQWRQILTSANIEGITLQIASDASLKSFDGQRLSLVFHESNRTLITAQFKQRLSEQLNAHFKQDIQLELSFTDQALTSTPRILQDRENQTQLDNQLKQLNQNPGLQHLQQTLGAEIIPETIQSNHEE